MQSSGTFHPHRITAVFVGRHTNHANVGLVINLLKRISNDLTVVLCGNSVPEGEIQLAPDKLFLIGQQIETESQEIHTSLKKVIELSPQSDDLLIFASPNAPIPSEKDLRRMIKKELDFISAASLGCDKISMQYARHLVTTGETPSVTNAIKNGFSTTMSLAEIIMSPRAAIRRYSTILKFGLVGASGIVVNLAVLTLLRGIMPVLAANIIAQELSIINNFTWNDRFTFNVGGAHNRLFTLARLYRFVKYNLVSLFSLSVNEVVFYLAYYQSHLQFVSGNYITSSLIAILTAFVVNYLGSSRWAWARPVRFPVKD